jgi:hypothetical protein
MSIMQVIVSIDQILIFTKCAATSGFQTMRACSRAPMLSRSIMISPDVSSFVPGDIMMLNSVFLCLVFLASSSHLRAAASLLDVHLFPFSPPEIPARRLPLSLFSLPWFAYCFGPLPRRSTFCFLFWKPNSKLAHWVYVKIIYKVRSFLFTTQTSWGRHDCVWAKIARGFHEFWFSALVRIELYFLPENSS